MIDKIVNILKNAKCEVAKLNEEREFKLTENFVNDNSSGCDLFFEDNINTLNFLVKKEIKNLDLIYIDPPFASKANYSAKLKLHDETGKEVIMNSLVYKDNWKKDLIGYLEMLVPRLYIMKKLLSDRGSIYVHVDWHASHYVKIIMDEIFGRENFINEIIWNYKSGGASKRRFARKHDTIFLYSKTDDYIFNSQKEKSYNRGFRKYSFKGVKEYADDIGWHTLVNMKDTWDIDMVGRTSRERVEYTTQKPLKLLERIIRVSTDENSTVADFFAGSGTTAIAADMLGRKCICADSSSKSMNTMQKRLFDNNIAYRYYESSKKINLNNFSLECNFDGGELNIINAFYKDITKLPLKKADVNKFSMLVEKDFSNVIDNTYALNLKDDVYSFGKGFTEFNAYKIVDIFGNYCYVEIDK